MFVLWQTLIVISLSLRVLLSEDLDLRRAMIVGEDA